jgi:hypothetical protein
MQFHFAAQSQMIMQGIKVYKTDSFAGALWPELYQHIFFYFCVERQLQKIFYFTSVCCHVFACKEYVKKVVNIITFICDFIT